MEKLLLTKRQAAGVLGVHPATVMRLVEAGTLEAIRLQPNGRPRFRVRDVEALAGVSKEREEARIA